MFARILSKGSQSLNVTWLLWVALGSFAVIVVIGWLVSRGGKSKSEPSGDHGHKKAHD